jgi:predicted dehydrogenase
MANPLKVGVIGIAGIARTHYPGWQESPHTEVCALADIDAEARRKFGEQLNVSLLYEKGEDLIANKDIDLVDICTPNKFHKPLVIAALEAGKHVICEKPLAPTPEDVREIIAARDRSGKQLMVAQHYRYNGAVRALKNEIDTGVLGEVYHARGWMLRRSGAPCRIGFIRKDLSAGGPCIDIGVHILDMALWMMGHPRPVSVTGVTHDRLRRLPGAFSDWGGPIPAEWDVEEMAAAMIRFENGASLILEVSWLLNHKSVGEDIQLWLYGERGGAHYPSNELYITSNRTKQHMNIQLLNAEKGEPHAMECIDFAAALAEGRPAPVPPEDSLILITILDALYQSAASGSEVKLDPESFVKKEEQPLAKAV